MRSGKTLVAAAIAASALLIGVYLVAGGGDYQPTPVADPCAAREWRSPEGIEEAAQQFFLSALDGAACELGVPREELAVALATEDSRQAFAAEHGIEDAELESAVRAGVERAITDAEDADAVSAPVADGLRANRGPIARRRADLPDRGCERDFQRRRGILDDLGGLLDQAGQLLP